MAIRGSKKREAMKASNSPDIKVTVIGEGAVGKTSLIRRWAEGMFEKTYLETLGVDITDKIIQIDNFVFKMVLWDIAGQERYKTFRNAFYSGTQGVIIVADITNPASLDAIPNWKEELNQYTNKKLPSVLLVNKADLIEDRNIGSKEILKVGRLLGIPENCIYETSALFGQNVENAFQMMARLVKLQN